MTNDGHDRFEPDPLYGSLFLASIAAIILCVGSLLIRVLLA